MKTHICQSCGMPLRDPGMYGTDYRGNHIEDYCHYCYREGGFTSDVTMEEMMRLCADYVDSTKRTYYMADMRTLYPHLKRWAKKEDTQNEYYRSINRALDYTRRNLHENTDLKTLAGVARISPYHFHRIFRGVMGEPLAEYVNRLRMEYVADQLKHSALSLAELADRTGYSSEQALSRAFKRYFGLPPRTFKATFFKESFRDELTPRICRVASRKVVALKDGGGWQKLYMYALAKRLLTEATESLEIIEDGWRPAVTVQENHSEDRHAATITLPEGIYAIFTHRGDTAFVPRLYDAVNNYWIPASKYLKASPPSYAVYLSNSSVVAPEDLLTEIYVPIVQK